MFDVELILRLEVAVILMSLPLVIFISFDAVEIAIVPAPSDRRIIVPTPVGAACIRIEPVCVTFKSPLLPE
jgi:hypothetical protein